MQQVHTAYPPPYWWCAFSILMVWHICVSYPPLNDDMSPPYWIRSTILLILHCTAYNLYRVNLFSFRWDFSACMNTQEMFLDKIYKKPHMFFKMVVKNCFHHEMQWKNCLKHVFFRKIVCKSQKIPPPPWKVMVCPLRQGSDSIFWKSTYILFWGVRSEDFASATLPTTPPWFSRQY